MPTMYHLITEDTADDDFGDSNQEVPARHSRRISRRISMSYSYPKIQAPEWYFKDDNGEVQGPFTDIAMRQWYVAGYFLPTILVHEDPVHDEGQFVELQNAFPMIEDAFLVPVQAIRKKHRRQQSSVQYATSASASFKSASTTDNVSFKLRGSTLPEGIEEGTEALEEYAEESRDGDQELRLSDFDFEMDGRFAFHQRALFPSPPKFVGVTKIYPTKKRGRNRKQTVAMESPYRRAVEGRSGKGWNLVRSFFGINRDVSSQENLSILDSSMGKDAIIDRCQAMLSAIKSAIGSSNQEEQIRKLVGLLERQHDELRLTT